MGFATRRSKICFETNLKIRKMDSSDLKDCSPPFMKLQFRQHTKSWFIMKKFQPAILTSLLLLTILSLDFCLRNLSVCQQFNASPLLAFGPIFFSKLTRINVTGQEQPLISRTGLGVKNLTSSTEAIGEKKGVSRGDQFVSKLS